MHPAGSAVRGQHRAPSPPAASSSGPCVSGAFAFDVDPGAPDPGSLPSTFPHATTANATIHEATERLLVAASEHASCRGDFRMLSRADRARP
jgi:hypothetical protein